MAVAGLHNVSAFGSSLFGESQTTVSRRWGEPGDRPSNRASSLLQMWRELEGEQAPINSPRPRQERSDDSDNLSSLTSDGRGSENGYESSEDENEAGDQFQMGAGNEQEDGNSIRLGQSSDLGEVERERVREIFREWMKNNVKNHSPNCALINNRSRPQWLGENECERVRIIREWVQMNIQQRGNCTSQRDGVADVGTQIEQVRDGLVVNQSDAGSRRPIQRLCGRQTLIDLLFRAQWERKRELQVLGEQKPVSDFAHRNRIQALLRGRFLQNSRSTQEERPSSVAAAELGLLRQRHTVAGLREEFLSRSDSFTHCSANSPQSDVSLNDCHMAGESQSRHEEETRSEIEPFREEDITGLHTTQDCERVTDRDTLVQESIQLADSIAMVLGSERRNTEVFSAVEFTVNEHDRENNDPRTLGENNTPNDWSSGDVTGSEQGHFPEVREALQELVEPRSEGNEELHSQETSYIEETNDSVMENEESDWQHLTGAEFSEWADGNGEDVGASWQDMIANQWFQESSVNDDGEHGQVHESRENWQGQDLQEAIDIWLDTPAEEESSSLGRVDSSYFPENMELRELFSRRRVSSLLRSGFRESLNQVIQSYVERQVHESNEWDTDNTSSSALTEQDQQHQDNGQNVSLPDVAEADIFVPSSPHANASQSIWDQELLHGANWPQNHSHPQFGIEWDMINELRIDMARLQQRMNNMQRMLEACMDMQIELQRSVRQEVSAALNRSFVTTEACEGNMPKNESQWDHVKKGICCVCSDGNIDSLLYRCGHMCTCSRCADKLVQGRGKCPMCHAPVVEAVRAYFTQ